MAVPKYYEFHKPILEFLGDGNEHANREIRAEMIRKQWDIGSSIGRPTIQGFVGAIAGRDGKGLFVTTADFSQPARDYAKTQHIVLINGKALVKLMVEHNFCVSIKHAYEIKAVDEDALSDYQNE